MCVFPTEKESQRESGLVFNFDAFFVLQSYNSHNEHENSYWEYTVKETFFDVKAQFHSWKKITTAGRDQSLTPPAETPQMDAEVVGERFTGKSSWEGAGDS